MIVLRASIVVLCYNGLEETTRPCLESIITNTPADSYELIVVDNASADGTAEYLKNFAVQHPNNVRIQLNDTNKGYAGGNNDGIRLAQGQYIVLLNNDTLVPCGWLERLLKLFDEQAGVGMVGPITNSAGNEQRIELKGLNENNFEEIAGSYTERQEGVWFTTEKLGFFCVAMRRTLMEKIGYLDEKFGIGMFEDDDYCIRAKRAGFTIAVVEDCFVYHKGSVSFGKLAVESYHALFEKNKAYFREKHGLEWALTDIAFSYWEKLDSDLVAYVKNSKEVSPEIERILVRHENFQHLLVQIHRAELASTSSNMRTASSPIVARAKWRIRWRNFNRNVVHGTAAEKLCYIRTVSGKILHRFGLNRGVGLPQEPLKKLNDIRETLNGRRLVIFPATVDFHYMAQRPQHLARAFAEAGHVVIYGTLNHQIDKVDITEQVADDLYLLNERYFPYIPHVFKPEECVYYCLWPNNVKHLEYLSYSYLLYDYMDELSLLDLPSNELERDHLSLLNQADLVTVSADKLMDQLPKQILPKALLINNAVSQEFINAVGACDHVPVELEVWNNHPILGYYGAIAEWLDFDLIESLAEELPDSKIVLIGPVSDNVSKRVANILRNYSNIMVLPACKQMELIPFLKRFDVCLIPFIKNTVTDAVSPVKLFEYFSAGKAVVTTNLVECVKYSPVLVANDHEQFISLVQRIVSEAPEKLDVAAQQIALNNTWGHRIQEIKWLMSSKGVLPENILSNTVNSNLPTEIQSPRKEYHLKDVNT
jgi:GT2 family glycosyltransferase/glycosyltransferase involved in cell wall biosynthesis